MTGRRQEANESASNRDFCIPQHRTIKNRPTPRKLSYTAFLQSTLTTSNLFSSLEFRLLQNFASH